VGKEKNPTMAKRRPNKPDKATPTPRPTKRKKTTAKKDTSIPQYWYWLGGILLFTFLVYSSSIQNDFVNWDDDSNIVNNPYVRNFDIITIFTETYSNAYRPLTFLSFSVLYQFFGANAAPFHLVSLLFHLFNVVLIFKIFKTLGKTDNFALIVAGLFSIHPMAVEAISWASALNDVMYVAFFMGAALLYLQEKKSAWIYVLFVLSLLTKPSAIVFPFVLLLFDWYKTGKLEQKQLIQKLPLVAIAVIFAVVSVLARNNSAEVSQLSADYSFVDRIFFAFYGMAYYGVKLFAPFNLSAIHYFPEKVSGALPTMYYLAPILSGIAILAAVYFKNHRKAIIFGLAFYVINLALVVQLIPFGRAVVAERYAYMPYIGLFFLIAYMYSLVKKDLQTYFLYAVVGLGVFFSIVTYNRTTIWSDGITLFDNIIEHYPNNAMSYYNRGNEYNRQGQSVLAMEDFDKAISLNDKSASFYNNKANTFTLLNKHELSIEWYNKAISLEPNTANFYQNRGLALKVLKRMDEAVKDFHKAIELKEDYTQPHLQLGDYYFNSGQYNEARRFYTRCIKDGYEAGYANFYIGVADYNLGSKETACEYWEKSRQLGYAQSSKMIDERCR
jgi:tetratricopeptide (TPR) repeat protein